MSRYAGGPREQGGWCSQLCSGGSCVSASPGDTGLVVEAPSLGFLRNEKFGFKQSLSYRNMHTNHVGVLSKCRFWFGRSGQGPVILHFS